jgi:hypothetical protein
MLYRKLLLRNVFITIKDTNLGFHFKNIKRRGIFLNRLKDEDFITNSVLLLIIVKWFTVPKRRFKNRFPQKDKIVYFQKWIGGELKTAEHFYIEFEEPLQDIKLSKIYFQNS